LANHKSALKRARQNENRRLRNKSSKSAVKNTVKDLRTAASNKEDKVSTVKKLDTTKSIIDKAAKKGILHKRTAARKISRLTKLVNSAN
jgi:small subunit ribosomal protein S20